MLGIRVCQKTLQRFLHRIRFSWRRIRRRVKGRPDPAEYQEKKAQLEAYQQEARAGNIDLYYADQSGFCLTPPVPYAWQEKGAPIEIPTSNSRKLNVMGFLNPLTHTLTAIRLKLISRGRWQAPVLITFAIQFPKKRS